MAMSFLEGSIEEEKVFGNAVFPKTLLPSTTSQSSVENLVETIIRDRVSLAKMLQSHGAILIRGFQVCSAEDFDRVVGSFGWEDMEYVGIATRVRITDRVSTANVIPLDQFINFHHEMAFTKESPSKILFFCDEPAPEGGETSIIPSSVVVDKMEQHLPEFMAKLSELGFMYRIRTLQENAENENEYAKFSIFLNSKLCRERLDYSSVSYNSDGSAEFVLGPDNPIEVRGGKRVWSKPFLVYSFDKIKTSFGDGSTIPEKAMSTCRDILEENCVNVKWQKGDVLVLDNHAVQHARRPGKPPRRILVSLCK